MKRLVIFVVGVLAMLTLGSCDPQKEGTEPEKKVPSIVGMWTCSEIKLSDGGMTMTFPIEECIVFVFNENGTGGIGTYEATQYNEDAHFSSYELKEDGTITIVANMNGDGGTEQMIGRYILDGEDAMRLELSTKEYELLTFDLLKGIHSEVVVTTPTDYYDQLPEPSPTDPVKNSIWLLTAYGMIGEGMEITISADEANEGDILELHFGDDGTGEVCTTVYVAGKQFNEKSPFTYTYSPEDGMIQFVEASLEQESFRVVREEDSMRLIVGMDGEYQIMYFDCVEQCVAE